MPDIKTKPAAPLPKVRQTDAAPKDAAGALRKDYEKAGEQRRPKGAEPVRYATDSVEEYGRKGGTRHNQAERRKRKRRGAAAAG